MTLQTVFLDALVGSMQTRHRFDLNLNIPIIHIMFMFLHQSRIKLYHEFSLYLRIRKVENYVFPAYSSHVNFLTTPEKRHVFLSFHFLQHLNQNPSQASLESAFQSPPSPPKKNRMGLCLKNRTSFGKGGESSSIDPTPLWHEKEQMDLPNPWVFQIPPICPSLREFRRLERFHCQWSLRWTGLPQVPWWLIQWTMWRWLMGEKNI